MITKLSRRKIATVVAERLLEGDKTIIKDLAGYLFYTKQTRSINLLIRDIEKAIMDSDVGITPENNGELIRLNLPQPTEERRRDLVKQSNKIGERTKVEVRNARADIKDKLKKAIKDGLSEDLEKDAEEDLQKIHDKYIKKIDALLADKEKEIMTV